MPKLLCVYTSKGISQVDTAAKMRAKLIDSCLSQRTVCRRMGVYPDRLCCLLQARRYPWSEEIAARFLEALK
jgi:hypothetical protein